jgi:hypothetical protein
VPKGLGYTQSERNQITAFFERITPQLNEFAAKHRLEIDKYYHDGADWTFRFAHPLGGNAQIQVIKESESRLSVACAYKDDYDSFSRFIKHETANSVSIAPENLLPALERALKTALSWRDGQWTQVATGYQYSWGQYTKEEFEKMQPKYRLLRTDEDS